MNTPELVCIEFHIVVFDPLLYNPQFSLYVCWVCRWCNMYSYHALSAEEYVANFQVDVTNKNKE